MSNIKQGYKQTDIGVIPKEWEVAKFGQLGIPSESRINPQSTSKNYKCIELEHIAQRSGLLIDYADSKDLLSQKAVFEKEDVLFGKLRPYLRKYWFAEFDGVCTTEIWVLKSTKKVSNKYLFYLVQSDQIIEAANLSTGTKMPRAEWKIVRDTDVALPTDLSEQTAIATSLSDIDALIAALNKKITKKQQINQGAMQQLLTGKKRLPGFSGEWVEKKLSELVYNIKTGKRNGEDNDVYGKYPFFVRSKNTLRLNSYSFDGEAILIPGEGGIGTIFHYIDGKFDYHQRVYKISNFSYETSGKFVFYNMKFFFGSYALQNSVKATVDSLRLSTFLEYKMIIPKTKYEQNAIAQILTDMDNEIIQLEKERDKYVQLKAGMMQVLLTGKTRLT